MLKRLPTFSWPLLAWGLALIVAIDAGYYGVAVRVWLWDHSGDSLRFPFDIGNAWNRGMDVYRLAVEINQGRQPEMPAPGRALPKLTWPQWFRGFRADYDHTVAQHQQGDYGLDYAPLRLLIMSGWVKYTLDHHPGITDWNDTITWPLTWLNTICEMIAAVSAGLLVWLWSRRAALARGQLPILLGLLAYLLLWFNPTILLEAHAWPQWEVWLIAAYLLAALLLSLNWPVAAGMVIAVGGMMKGQMLLTAPLLILWPLFAGQGWTALRLLLGIALAATVLLSGWLLPDFHLAWLVAGAATLAFLAILLLPLFIRRLRQPLLMLRIATLWSSATIALAIIFCAWHYGGSLSWYKVGYEYGTRHFQAMNMGHSMNLARVLNEAYDWHLHDPAGVLIIGSDCLRWPLDLRAAMILVYIVSLILCAIAAAIHSRRRDPRILIAIAAPWVLFFALLTQMHERYLVWACGITAIAAGVSLGMTLLHLLVSFLAMAMILPGMLGSHLILPQTFGTRFGNTLANGWPNDWPRILTDYLPTPRHVMKFIEAARPGLGWATLLVAGVFLVYACTPSPRQRAIKTI